MKRIALAAAAALLGTGCTSSSPSTGSVDFAWSFTRYDTNGAPITAYTCAEAGIDNVVVSFQLDGDVQVPCSDAAGDGALIGAIPAGTQTVFVTGRRGSHALYRSQTFTISVAANQTTVAGAVDVLGIAGDLYVYANFLDRLGDVVPNWIRCADVGVQTLEYRIVDYANTVVAHGTVPCTDPAGVSFVGGRALDLDNYAIRMRAFRTGVADPIFDSATTAVAPTCSGQAFNHFGLGDSWDVALFDVTQNTTVCQ